MIRTISVLTCIALLFGCSESAGPGQRNLSEPGLIRDGDAAIGMAMHAYLSMRGETVDADALEAWRAGSQAKLRDGVWEVSDATGFSYWSLVFHVAASDGRIIDISHRSPDGKTLLPLTINHAP